ncbi:FecR family protein [Compostibacter hankyongensis]|uniref:DUF4974 domain-containing protein n=1 Tax=Compostibacter hankyongensis TaxID=1007089 RepID=A0ABP8FBR7_9BACT
MDKEPLLRLVKKIAAGTASETEKAIFDRLYQHFQQEELAEEDVFPEGRKKMARKLWKRIREDTLDREQPSFSVRRKAWKAAAALTLLTGLSLMAYLLHQYTGRYHPPDVVHRITGTGEQRRIILPDSSSVWLNAGSRLSYERHFSGNGRELFLEGEAYFEVKHRQGSPFVIHTAGVVITDLGTEFNVNAYPEDDSVTVTVTGGKVQVSLQQQQARLTADQQLSYYKSSGTLAQKRVDGNAASAWRNGKLFFDGIPLEAVIRQLKRTYNISITVVNKQIITCPVYGDFSHTHIRESLQLLAESLGATLRETGGSYRITGGSCH